MVEGLKSKVEYLQLIFMRKENNMAGITRFEEIDAWKTARELTNKIYALGNQVGFNKDFGLRDQIRRASVSVMSNIAEGFESRTDVQFINFLGTARASAGEVRAQLYVAVDQKYITEEQFKESYELAEKSARQIAKFIAYLESNPRKRRVADDGSAYEV
jgi:four helix bundle protein